MDLIDVKILEELQNDARISLSTLSKNVNLSLSAVSERLRRLNASGVVKTYTAVLDHKALGKDLSVLMSISLESIDHTQAFLDYVMQEDEILECHDITDGFDYVLKIITKNTDSLERIMQNIKGIVKIKRTEVNIILSTPKLRYSVVPTADQTPVSGTKGGRL